MTERDVRWFACGLVFASVAGFIIHMVVGR
jgi:hypothetical protein